MQDQEKKESLHLMQESLDMQQRQQQQQQGQKVCGVLKTGGVCKKNAIQLH